MKTPLVRLAWLLPLCVALAPAAPATGWLAWRGPDQNLTSRETGLPATLTVGGPGQLWTADFPGQSTPVIANGRLYVMGYLGEGADLQEGVACFDAGTGRKLWQRLFNDYLSDTIYLRYATSSPAIDPETGNVYVQGTQGMFGCFDADGRLPVNVDGGLKSFGHPVGASGLRIRDGTGRRNLRHFGRLDIGIGGGDRDADGRG